MIYYFSHEGSTLVSLLQDWAPELQSFIRLVPYDELSTVSRSKPCRGHCIGDVHKTSRIARFLNEFVNEHTEDGHAGEFLGEHTLTDIANAGLRLEQSRMVSYPWMFGSTAEMVQFCTKLFGLGRASAATVLDGLRSHVGFETDENRVLMNWELYFVRAIKPAM